MVMVPVTVPVGAVIATVGAVVSPPVVVALKVAICMSQDAEPPRFAVAV